MGKSAGSGKKFWREQFPTTEGSPEAPYWRKTCDLCPAKGLYRWGNKVVCRAHLEALKADMEKASNKWASRFGTYYKGKDNG